MKQDDREKRQPTPGWEERIEAAYLRIQAGLPPVPWLPYLPTLAGLRRQVRRARAGVVGSGTPRLSTRAWADTIEQGIVMDMLEREAARKEIEEEKRQEAEKQQQLREYDRQWMDLYRKLLRFPEASDPNSEIGAEVLELKRELRKQRGRPRKRKGREGRKGRGKTSRGPAPE